jgi:dCMP deaminase
MDFTSLLHLAYEMAEHSSTDPRTQNGAVLLCMNGRQVKGANHFPRGVRNTPQRWEKPLKYQVVEHAERNAIYRAAMLGIATDNATLVVPWFACADCARGIIQSGIKMVIGHDAPFHNRPDWQSNIDIADQMLKEAGVDFIRIKHKFSGIQIRFDGVIVEP